jgi:hypothetical protein
MFLPCKKILIDSYFIHVVFLFLFFLFHDLDLKLSLPLFSSWLGNLINLVVFVPMTLYNFV